MDLLQEIVAFIILGFALFYLFRKFFWKKKNKKNCGPNDCDCH
jgi:glycopeptide antibiotics resistance protein